MLSGEQCWNGVVGTHNSPPPQKRNKIKTPRFPPVLLPNGFFPPPRNLALSLTPPPPPPPQPVPLLLWVFSWRQTARYGRGGKNRRFVERKGQGRFEIEALHGGS